MVKQRRLLWVAVGAGLASLAWLIAYFSLAYATRDDRYMVIYIENAQQQAAIVEAVGECRGHFKILKTSETNELWIPLTSLNSTDFVCLLDKLQNAAVEIDPKQQPRTLHDKVLIRPKIQIEKWTLPFKL